MAPTMEQPAAQPAAGTGLEGVQTVIENATANLKTEIDSKFMEMEQKINSITELEGKLQAIISDLDEMKGRYTAISERIEKIAELEDSVSEVKGNVNSMLQILKSALPPMIKTLKEIKEGKGP